MDKIKIYYISICPPEKVRIKSECLCLDYTFDARSSQQCVSVGDMIKLSGEPYIDLVMIYLDDDNGAYYIDEMTDEKKIFLHGWYNADFFEDGMPNYPESKKEAENYD